MLKLITAAILSLLLSASAHALTETELQACPAPELSELKSNKDHSEGMSIVLQFYAAQKTQLQQLFSVTGIILAENAETCESLESSVVAYYLNVSSTTLSAYKKLVAQTLTVEGFQSKVEEALFSVYDANTSQEN